MKKNNNQIDNFIIQAKYYLNSYFQLLIQNDHFSLDKIYPIEIPQDLISDDLPNDINLLDYLGELYENTLSPKTKKDLGQFYTRDNTLIDSMVNNINLFEGKILEPSCGSGLFLVNIVNRICIEMHSQKKCAKEILEYVQNNIYGNDSDLIALKITEINLLAILLPTIVSALNENPNFRLSAFKLSQNDFTQKDVIKQEFSLIIGNPPFVTMYGKRSRNMTEDKRAYFNTFDFVQNKSGNNKFNLSMFFVENGLKSLIPNGRMIFILDIAFFETAYIDLRRYLIKNYHINSITKGLQAFDGVASGQIIIDISNNNYPNDNVHFTDYNENINQIISQHLWDDAVNKYKIYLPLTSYAKDINDKMLLFPKLDVFFPGKALRTCCALTGKTEEFIVDPRIKSEHTVFPYIEGSKGLKEKFGHLYPTRYIKYDYNLQLEISEQFKIELEAQGVKNKKRVTLGDKDAYLSPKIFIRQSALEIIATYTDKPFAANNSIYILTNKSFSTEDSHLLKYICGILNSDLITYYCRINKIIRIEKGKTPQIKTSDLKDIRICIDNNNYNRMINLVEQLLLSPSNTSLYKELNDIVYKMYKITPAEQEYILSYIS